MNGKLARFGLKALTVALTLFLFLCYRAASEDGIDGADALLLLVIAGAAVYAYLKADAMPRENYREERDK